MARKSNILLKKQAKQSRSQETILAIVQAGTYILQKDGPSKFTAQRVAEKAGVNIASFYQYFPNKKALLFHITKLKWESDSALLAPVLNQGGSNHAERLKNFVREFFLMKAAKAELRQALRIASIEIKDTEEFKAMRKKSVNMTREFIEAAVKPRRPDDLSFDAEFIGTLIASFAEQTTDNGVSGSKLVRQADFLTDMIITQFQIR